MALRLGAKSPTEAGLKAFSSANVRRVGMLVAPYSPSGDPSEAWLFLVAYGGVGRTWLCRPEWLSLRYPYGEYPRLPLLRWYVGPPNADAASYTFHSSMW